MEFTEPTDADITRIARHVLAVCGLARTLGLPDLAGTVEDLATLQAILDSGTVASEDTYLLQSLGIAFGRVLVAEVDGLDWAIVHDEYGSDPTLRYRNMPLCVNVLTAISKRVEDGDAFRMAELFEGFVESLERAIANAGGSA